MSARKMAGVGLTLILFAAIAAAFAVDAAAARHQAGATKLEKITRPTSPAALG